MPRPEGISHIPWQGRSDFKIGTTIRVKDWLKIKKISKFTGRSVSDLLKDGIWKVIKEDEYEQKETDIKKD